MNATMIQIAVPVEPIQLFCVQHHEDHIPTFPKKSSDGRMITNQFLFQTVKVRNICEGSKRKSVQTPDAVRTTKASATAVARPQQVLVNIPSGSLIGPKSSQVLSRQRLSIPDAEVSNQLTESNNATEVVNNAALQDLS